MMVLMILAMLLSSCHAYEHIDNSADVASGESENLSLVVENHEIVLKQQEHKVATMQITQLTTQPLTNNDSVRGLKAVFLDIGNDSNSISQLRLSDLQLSYSNSGNTVTCHFNSIPLGGNLPAASCTGMGGGGKTGNSGGWTNTPSDSQQSLAMQQRIVGASFDLSIEDKYGMTLLHWAATKPKNTKAIRFFLAQKIFNINAANINGNTPLHLAALFSDKEGLRLLAETPGINKTLRNHDGKTAYDIAIRKGWWGVAALLH